MTGDPNSDRIEALIRDHLERQESRIDPQSVLNAIKERQKITPQKPLWVKATKWTMGSIAIAACLFIAISLIPPTESVQASPEKYVREAAAAHALQTDHCYDVESVWDEDMPRRFPILLAQKKAKLWTRGDRFLIETNIPDTRKWIFGKDEAGNFWITPGPKLGLTFAPDEIGEWVTVLCQILSMKMETLLSEMIASFDLAIEPASNEQNIRIVGTPRPLRRHPGLNGVTIEINKKTKLVELLILNRVFRPIGPKGPNFEATVTYKHIEDAQLKDEQYQLKGNLDPDHRIFGPFNPKIRGDWLQRVIGKRALDKGPPKFDSKQ